MTKKHRSSHRTSNSLPVAKISSDLTNLASLGIVAATGVNMTAQITGAIKK